MPDGEAEGSGAVPFPEAPVPVEGALVSVAVPGAPGAPGPETPVPLGPGTLLGLEPAAPLPLCAQANGAVARSATRPRETMLNPRSWSREAERRPASVSMRATWVPLADGCRACGRHGVCGPGNAVA